MKLFDSMKRSPQKSLVKENLGLGAALTTPTGLKFHRGLLNPEQVVDNGEMAVSLLQKAVLEIRKIEGCLQTIEKEVSVKLSEGAQLLSADQKLDTVIQTQLALIRHFVKDAAFRDRNMLNGGLGVQGAGKNTKVITSPDGLPGGSRVQVELQKMASHSVLTGHQRLSSVQIRKETQITLSENGNIVKYRISPNETVSSLIQGLQQKVIENGLDLEIGVNADGYLEVVHNQYGSSFVFSGRSQATSIVSKRPDTLQFCQLGENCAGTINGDAVKSRGQLLLCEHGELEGLAVLWEGEKPGTDELMISRNSIPVSGGSFLPQTNLWISIRAMMPEDLARGVKNHSGFGSLADICVQSQQAAYDSLHLIRVSMAELEECRSVLENRIFQFQEMAMSALMVTGFHDEICQSSQTVSESASLMAKMLEEALAA
ncbi:MAG: hypothetical protein HQM14_19315 [SAR324 cluster bacterium]|nr:hypothetical protein [SAR324 cluster bacterium]